MNYEEKAKELFEVLTQSNHSISDIQRNCSAGEAGVLLYLLLKENNIYPSELSDKLEVSLPRIMAIVKSLEAKNFVEAITDKDDRRKRIVYITEKGKNEIIQKKEEAITKTANIFRKLEDSEVENFIYLIKKIKKIMQEEK